MSIERTSDISFIRYLLKNIWVRSCCAVLLFVAIALITLPHGLRIKLEQWLVENGADQAEINKIELNLFTGKASLKGMDVTLDEKTVLADADITVDLGLTALFKRHARIQKATLHKVVLEVEHYSDGHWRFGSYSTRPGDAEEDPVDEVKEPWIFDADRIDLSECLIHFTQPDLEVTLFIRDASLENFTTGPGDSKAMLALEGQLNKAPLMVRLHTLQISPDIAMQGNITASGLKLEDFKDILGDSLSTFAGTAAADGKFSFALSQETSLEADYEGDIELAEGNIKAGYGLAGKRISWSGPIDFRQEKHGVIAATLDGTLQGSGFMLDLPDMELKIAEESFDFTGKTTVTLDSDLTVSNNGSIILTGTDFTMPPYMVKKTAMSWKGEALYSSAGQNIKISGSLDLGEPSLDLAGEETTTVAGESISWQGTVELQEKESGRALLLAGELDVKDIGVALPGPGLKYSQKSFRISSDLSLPIENPRSLAGNVDMQAEGSLLKDLSNGQELASLDRLSVENLSAPGGQSVTIDRVNATKIGLTSPANSALSVTVPEITLDLVQADNMQNFSAESLLIKSLKARNTGSNKQLASIESIQLNEISADESFTFSAADLVVRQASLFEQSVQEQKENFLQLSRLSVTRPVLQNKTNLNIAGIILEDMQVNLVKDANGNLLFTSELTGLTGADPVEPAEEAQGEQGPSPSLTFKVGEISVTGDSAFHFRDHSLALPYEANLEIDTLQVKNIDSSQPDLETEFALSGKLAKYATVAVNGTVKPFAELLSLQQTADLQNYPMMHLAPYSHKYFGIVPTQGTINSNTSFSIDSGYVNMEEKLLIKKLEIKTVDEKLAKEFNDQLPLPLDSALSILKDKKDNIELTIPLSGPADDVDLSIAGLIIAPLSKAIVTASSTYFLYTLGPYGIAAYVGLKVGEKIMETKLPPVEFEPGKNELIEDHKKYLQRIAEILVNRPKLTLQLCAWVVPTEHLPPDAKKESVAQRSDPSSNEIEQILEIGQYQLSPEDKDTLLLLGNTRATVIKDYLMREHDIEPGRLIICLPEFDMDQGAKPRVELEI